MTELITFDPRHVLADFAPAADIEWVAQRAQIVVTDVRRYDPLKVRHALAIACATEPVRMAQILMALGAWVNDDELLSTRGTRVEAITGERRS